MINIKNVDFDFLWFRGWSLFKKLIYAIEKGLTGRRQIWLWGKSKDWSVEEEGHSNAPTYEKNLRIQDQKMQLVFQKYFLNKKKRLCCYLTKYSLSENLSGKMENHNITYLIQCSSVDIICKKVNQRSTRWTFVYF